MWLFTELNRRNVFRVAIAYLAASWLFIQVVETLFPVFGLSDTRIRIIAILLFIGFPLVLIFSWLYELTPEGLKLERDVDRAESVLHHTGKKIDRAIIVVLTVALGYFALDKFVLEPQRDAVQMEQATVAAVEKAFADVAAAVPDRSIVVLPFVDLSAGGDQEYFSDGIAEELLNLLVKIPELRVISRTSAFSFRDTNITIPEIAAKLKVAHVLTGSVRKHGQQVRITAQLIDANNDANLWSGSYDRAMDDIFTVQEQIATLVIRELKVSMLDEVSAADETDSVAYALFLRARHLSRQGTEDSWTQSADIFHQVLAIDPDFAPAWAGLAGNYIRQSSAGLTDIDEGFELARDAAQRALALNRNFAPALSYLGWISMYYDEDLQAAASYFQEALEQETSSDVIGNAATLTQNLGRLDETIALREWNVAHDPVNANGYYMLGNTYLDAGRTDQAIQAYETALSLSPGLMGAWYGIGLSRLLKNEPGNALEAFKKEEGDEEYRVKGMALAYYELGNLREYEKFFTELRKVWGGEWPSEVAHVYAWTGDSDLAFEWLDRAVANERGLAEQFLHPFYQPLHADPRWAQFRERTGTAPDQLDLIKFNVILPE